VQPFAKTDEQTLLAENVGRLMREANDFDARRRRLREATPDRLALWPALTELGVLAAAFDETHGGFAGDARTMAVIMSEFGTALAVEPYLSNAVIAGRILRLDRRRTTNICPGAQSGKRPVRHPRRHRLE
jgi:alkylation response protein AidB-like acyl-CoA dehydrogenase